jgi:single-strand DNA-binding protein
MSTNVAILTGRMAQDPRVSQVQGHSGPRTIANFSLAVRRNYKNQAGEYEADFIDCIVSGRQADNVANWTRKGSRVTVVGELKTRNYENNQGQRVYVTEVNVREVEFLDPRDQNQQGQGYGQTGWYQQGGGYQQQPAQQQPAQQQPAQQTPNFAREPQRQQPQQGSFFKGSTTNPIDISDDDLPF